MELATKQSCMNRNTEVLVLIPSFNDTELLKELTGAVIALPDRFVPLVVDDGSLTEILYTDVAAGTLLVRCPVNTGLGTATHIAFDHAAKYGYGFVARIDSDGQHPVDSIPDIVRPLQTEEADMVVGHRLNRDDRGGPRALLAKSVRWYLTLISKLVSGGHTPEDMNSGCFAVTADAAAKLNRLYMDRYPEPKIFLSANPFGIRIIECGINQNDREFGRSTVNIFQAVMMLYRFHMLLLARLLQKKPL
jgi:glycosyltransferase involved in cell wall biosynthesis